MSDFATRSELGALEERVNNLEGEVSAVRDLHEMIEHLRASVDTLAPLNAAFENAKGGLRVLEVLGRMAKPITSIVIAAGVLWAWIHGSKP